MPFAASMMFVTMNSRGFQLVEVIVALVILAVALTLAMPYLTARPAQLRADTDELIANLKVARELSVARMRHYRVCVETEREYVMEEGELQPSGTWSFGEYRRLRLHPDVRFQDLAVCAEFNTRGQLVGNEAVFVLEDQRRGQVRRVVVRTTGMAGQL